MTNDELKTLIKLFGQETGFPGKLIKTLAHDLLDARGELDHAAQNGYVAVPVENLKKCLALADEAMYVAGISSEPGDPYFIPRMSNARNTFEAICHPTQWDGWRGSLARAIANRNRLQGLV